MENECWKTEPGLNKKNIHPDFSLNDDGSKYGWLDEFRGLMPYLSSNHPVRGWFQAPYCLQQFSEKNQLIEMVGWVDTLLRQRDVDLRFIIIHTEKFQWQSLPAFQHLSTYSSICPSINLSIYLFLCIGRSTQIRKWTKNFCIMIQMNILLPSSQCLSCFNAERWKHKNVMPCWWTTRG